MIQSQANAASVYTDLNGLQKINALGKEDKSAAMMQVAQQFESMFMNMMLSSMRKASDVLAEDSMLSSPESDFYRSMYDDQLAVSLTSGGATGRTGQSQQGTGLADVIHRQLMAQYGDDSHRVAKIDQDKIFDRRVPGFAHALKKVDEELGKLHELPKSTIHPFSDQAHTAKPTVAKATYESDISSITPISGKKGQQFATAADFVATLYPFAEKIGKEIGVDPKAIVAQAALETGWGKHTIQNQQGESVHNLFGIKAGSQWQGDVVSIGTHEYRQGVRVNETANFRAYASLEDGMEDYAKFLQESRRYQNAINQNVSGDDYGHALQKSGYATDPEYGRKIESIYHGDVLNSAVPMSSLAPAQRGVNIDG
ncbi:MAG: flagellar assembly peptidoglycan hydrolase FlgJ [Oleibacter sp.]|nr:flagellar assembly peptidoglycan hydrolase FlgJ [Thalassolituus sp.]